MPRISSIFLRCLAVSFLLASYERVAAGEEAREAFDAFLKERSGGKVEHVLGMVGFFGEPLPPQWLILFSTDLSRDVLHESVVSKGQIRAERTFRRLPNQDLPTIPIQRQELKIDSGRAFELAEEVAKKAKVSFENAHFQLRCRDAGKEPVWMIQFLGRAQVSLGSVYLSARSGEILRVSWVQPKAVPEKDSGLETFASGRGAN